MQVFVEDIVYLNSGSPELKVVSVTENGIVVTWQTEDTFPLACLRKTKTSPASTSCK
jgi:hypothetical protein